MKKILSMFLGVLFLVLFLISPINSFTYALDPVPTPCPADQAPSDFGCIPTDPVGFTQTFYGWGLFLISFVAALFMIIGGYYLMTSHGSFEQVQRGKSFIYYSIAGVALAVFGFVFIEIVTGDILKIPGFN